MLIIDFKINTLEAIAAYFTEAQFEKVCLNDNDKEQGINNINSEIDFLPVSKIEFGTYYRARKVRDEDGEETGIIREDGIPITGYDISHSGVPPKEAVRENGRINHKGEQVLYLAEDYITSIKECKADDAYFSVAECYISTNIQVVDFTYTTENGLQSAFHNNVDMPFSKDFCIALYMFIKQYLSADYYRRYDYMLSLKLLDLVKERNDVSGVKYLSSFTNGYNIALWDENKFLECKNSKVTRID